MMIAIPVSMTVLLAGSHSVARPQVTIRRAMLYDNGSGEHRRRAMTEVLSVHYDVSADGRTVAEAEVDGIAEARELIAAAAVADCELAWAHSAAELSSLGFARRPGYRRLTGRARPGPLPDGVAELSGREDTAELCAAAYRGQWGHKSPGTWPIPEFADTTVLGLRRDELIAGICRVVRATGQIDAPGLLLGQRDHAGYRLLLIAALSRIPVEQVTVESWGDAPDRVGICEELGLTTAEYCPGWELDLAGVGSRTGARS
jgi:hypothetical protein